MTNAQKWARIRNFSKFRLMGLQGNLGRMLKQAGSEGVFTSDEEVRLEDALHLLNEVLYNWKEQTSTSKKMYVKEVKK